MILTDTRFLINNEIIKAIKVDLEGGMIKINDIEDFKRIPLKEKHIQELHMPYTKTEFKYGWRKKGLLSNGKYKVTYNQIDYFMSFLDELDLFKKVVLQELL